MPRVVLKPLDEEDSQCRDGRRFVELCLLDVAADLEVDGDGVVGIGFGVGFGKSGVREGGVEGRGGRRCG